MKGDENKVVDLDVLKGQKIMSVEIQRVKDKEPETDFSDRVLFTLEDGRKFSLQNKKDCKEDVVICQINGHLPGILNSEILVTDKKRINVYRKNNLENFEIFIFKTKSCHVEIHFFCIQLCGFEAESVDLVEVEP